MLGGLELLHMLRKDQLVPSGLGTPNTATTEQFYPLAGQGREPSGGHSVR